VVEDPIEESREAFCKRADADLLPESSSSEPMPRMRPTIWP
jgi:hypothetical protein